MLYADYLRRSMEQLTAEAWEQLLTADPLQRPALRTAAVTCPCCRTSVTVELTVALLPVLALAAPTAEVAGDTELDLAAFTQADLALA